MVKYAFDIQNLIENNRVFQNEYNELKLWSTVQDDIPKLNNHQICLFLIACDNDIDSAKNCIKEYYLCRKNAPEIFDDRNIQNAQIQQQLKTQQFCVIPVRTADNNCIVINRSTDSSASNYNIDVAMKLLFMTYDSVLYENPPDGLIIIFDMAQTSWQYIFKAKLKTLQVCSHYAQEAMPIKLKEVHIINVLWFLDKFLAMIKPLMKKELFSKLHLHTADKMDFFYENHVPKSHLPEDYGGHLASMNELHRDNCKNLDLLTQYYAEEEVHRK